MALLPLRLRARHRFRRKRTSTPIPSSNPTPTTQPILTPPSQAAARTFDFSAGDTAVFPDNAGHYIENTSANETLQWIEIYKSDRVIDISLTQWLALTPPGIVAETLKIPLAVAQGLKKEKQLIIA
jgi:oxalate decarboxylase/phosphoglucose isomerase-like protein (cupin superfamily)